MEDKMRSKSAKYGHVTRRLLRNERLTGKVLESALSVVGQGSTGDYELHIMVDVLLLHKRLEGGTPINSSTPIELVGKTVPNPFGKPRR
jgi:hypothetical protein